jgi:uncharacterized membrane protein HdeD (DUF308 family)
MTLAPRPVRRKVNSGIIDTVISIGSRSPAARDFAGNRRLGMIRILVRNWWLLALRGGFALLFGLAAFSLRFEIQTPILRAVAFTTLVVIFALMAFVSGAFTIAAALWGGGIRAWWWLLLDGILACLAAVAVLMVPDLTLVELIHIIALWALVVSALELATAAKLRHHITDERFLALAAAGSFVFGSYLTFRGPGDVKGAMLWLGFYSLFSGAMMIALALRLRTWRHLPPEHPAEAL